MQPINMIISYYIKSSFIWILKSNHIILERSNQMTRAEIDWLHPTVHVKDQVFRRDFFRLLPTECLCIHIVRTSCCRLPVRSGIFCLLVEVVHWTFASEFVYLTINLPFLGIIVKIKLPSKLCFQSFEWFCLQIRNDTKYFPLCCSRHYDQGLIVVIVVVVSILLYGCTTWMLTKRMKKKFDSNYTRYWTSPEGSTHEAAAVRPLTTHHENCTS